MEHPVYVRAHARVSIPANKRGRRVCGGRHECFIRDIETGLITVAVLIFRILGNDYFFNSKLKFFPAEKKDRSRSRRVARRIVKSASDF